MYEAVYTESIIKTIRGIMLKRLTNEIGYIVKKFIWKSI